MSLILGLIFRPGSLFPPQEMRLCSFVVLGLPIYPATAEEAQHEEYNSPESSDVKSNYRMRSGNRKTDADGDGKYGHQDKGLRGHAFGGWLSATAQWSPVHQIIRAFPFPRQVDPGQLKLQFRLSLSPVCLGETITVGRRFGKAQTARRAGLGLVTDLVATFRAVY